MKHTISFRTILTTSLILVMLLVSAVQGFFLYYTTSREIAENIREVAEDTLDAHKENFNQYLRNIESLAFSIHNSPIIQNALRVSSDADFLTQYRSNLEVTSFLENLSFSYDDIVGISIVTRERGVYNYASSFGFYDADILSNKSLLSAFALNNKSGFIPTFDNDIIKNNSYKNAFCFYSKIMRSGKTSATICILISSDVFKRITAASLSTDEHLFLYSNDSLVYPYKNEEVASLPFVGQYSYNSPIQFQNQTYLPMLATLSNGWTLVDLVPTGKISRSSATIIQQTLLGFMIAFVLYFFFIVAISGYLSKHLNKLNRKMSTVGIKSYLFKGNSHISEINMLNEQYNQMSTRIDELVETVKNEQREIDKGNLELLQAQINPHFLYNTLDAINWMAIEHNADDISIMTSNLASMFRYSLNNGAELTCVRHEMSHLEKYIEIQKYRYNNRFSFSKQIDNTLLNQSMLNIILQPIVENSLVHGFRSSQDKISIVLKLKQDENQMVFTLLDDGVGCNPDFMNDYLSATQTSTKGYGVKNIHKRIRLHFGNNFGVRYLKTDVGTAVEIKIPIEGEICNV